jgi:16S rRNA pseudouridine516 synthase
LHQTPAYKLITATGRLTRKAIKQIKAYLYFEGADGRWETKGLHDPIQFTDSEWKHFVFRRERYRVRATQSPLLLLNKPAGFVTSRSLEEGATVFECIGAEGMAPFAEDLQPVGRLDRDTEGVLLLTTDGVLLHRLTHPKRSIERVYVARLGLTPDPAKLDALRAGELVLRDGHRPAVSSVDPLLPADGLCKGCPPWVAHGPDTSLWRVALAEGKYHEIRRIFAASEGRVDHLWRISYAGITLQDPSTQQWLPLGQWRRLSEAEVTTARAAVGLTPDVNWIDAQFIGPAPDDFSPAAPT